MFSLSSEAKKEFISGEINTLSYNTLLGKIDFQSDIINATSVTFQSMDGVVSTFKPLEIRSWQFRHERLYLSKEITIEKRINAFWETI
ncbi:MAG: hypothetical protein ACI93L_003693 [Cyclobacteriaceae bacterium]|jgi:hypothetical protein